MMEWQPIETAPRDGTKLLGYMSGDVADPYVFITWFMEVWQTGRYGGHLRDEDLLYWQPLPEAPKKKHRCVSPLNSCLYCYSEGDHFIVNICLSDGSVASAKCDYCCICGEAANPTKDEPTMPFGKYTGKKISELPQDYAQWLFDNKKAWAMGNEELWKQLINRKKKECDDLRREILNR